MTKQAARLFLFVVLLSGLLHSLNAQNNVSQGKLEIIQDSRMNLLLEKHIQLNAVIPGVMDGYRIQIFFDSGNESKKRAVDIRVDFLNRFPGIPAYLSFQEPFFKIRTGDFRSKLEADGFHIICNLVADERSYFEIYRKPPGA